MAEVFYPLSRTTRIEAGAEVESMRVGLVYDDGTRIVSAARMIVAEPLSYALARATVNSTVYTIEPSPVRAPGAVQPGQYDLALPGGVRLQQRVVSGRTQMDGLPPLEIMVAYT